MTFDKLPTYVFRGTTIAYQGNTNSIKIPVTCTSWHPVKALWFALECFQKDPEKAVIYIANTNRLKSLAIGYNHLGKLENEIAFNIEPQVFYSYCLGYVHVSQFQRILKDLGIDGYNVVRTDNLSRLCAETRPISVNKIESIVTTVLPILKNE